ncbi:serine hydrolase [Leptolyngbya cf. ectocarpi LEGE 11479]|uniref:Serine hydrolase n=2 Tax=Leptolyngbya ectocarpi TaxID=1202 RepID=A0A928ZV22_LEPEC|nr:serine hydrolase [Leptolyngbya cf. ectocarpi LEGE 11479]
MTTALITHPSNNISLATDVSTESFLERLNEIDIYLNTYAEIKQFSGTVLIAQGSHPPITRSYGLANREHQVANTVFTKFRIGSVTKQFTAAAILQLQEKGLLELQAPISTYLPDYPEGDRITVEHLLTHTAGIPEYLNPEIFPDLLEWIRQPSTLAQLVERFQALPLEFEPGETFRYSNSGYVLLTQIIEAVSNQTYADYLQTNIFDPLGMNDTGYEMPQTVIANLAQGYVLVGDGVYLQAAPLDMSIPQGAGGLYSTTADLATWTQWLHNEQPDATVLSAAAKTMLMQPVVQMEPETSPDMFYGYGMVADTRFDQPRVHHNGGISGFASSLVHYPEDSLTIAVLSNLETAVPARIAEDLAAISFQTPYELPQPHEAIDLDPSLYEKYVGTYQLLPEMQVMIQVVEGELTAQATGQDAFVLYPMSETDFFAQVADITVTFSLSEDKTVKGLTLRQLGQELFAPKVTDSY